MRNLLRWGRGKTQASMIGAAVQPDSVKPGKSDSEPEPFAAIDDLDLRRIGVVLWQKRAWIIIPTIAVAILSFVAVNMVTPRYKSEARIFVDGRENIFLRPNADRSEDRAQLDQEAVTSQVQLILSRDLARKVVKSERLNERPEFDPVLKGMSPMRAILSLFGIGRDPFKMTPEERVLDAYYERLTAYAVDKSRVIAVEFQSSDPDLAVRVANAVADGYLTLQQAARQKQARDASAWLSGEIDGLRKKVAEAESRVEEFRGQSNLFIGTNNTTLSGQQLGEINSQLASARAQKADAESRARFIRNMLKTGQSIEASEVLNSELIRRLSEQRVTLRAQLAEQSSTLLGNHPRIKELRAQIFDLDSQIRDEAGKLARSLETESKIAGAKVESLGGSLDQLKKQAASSSGDDVKLRALEREARAQRELLESYLGKYREAMTRESIDAVPADARIISRAIVSNNPAYPKKLPLVLIATLATLLLSSGIISTGELLRMTSGGRMRGAPERRATSFETAVAPRSKAMPINVTEISDLATKIIAEGAGASRILIAGIGGSKASLAALTLARAISHKRHCVLMDISSNNDELFAISSDQAAPGLENLVTGNATFSRIITRDTLSPLHFVLSGRGHVDPAMLQSPRLVMAMDALARVYDNLVLNADNVDHVPADLLGRMQRALFVIDENVDDSVLAHVQAILAKTDIAGVDFLLARAGDTTTQSVRLGKSILAA